MNVSNNNSRTDLSLNELFGNSNIQETSQIKFSEGQLYTDSFKPTGMLAFIRPFAALFRPQARVNQFRDANEALGNHIAEQYGSEAAEIFKNTFSSKLASGSPLTAGSVKRFVEANKTTLDEGKKMMALFQEGFGKGDVKTGTTEQIKDTIAQTPLGPEERITIMSKEMKSTKEMGFLTDDSPQFANTLIPTGGYARILGKDDRAKLVDTFLYKSSTNKSIIKGDINTSEKEVSDIRTTIDLLTSAMSNKESSPETFALLKKPYDTIRRVRELEQKSKDPDIDNETKQSLKLQLDDASRASDVILADSPEKMLQELNDKLTTASSKLETLKAATEGFENWSPQELLAYTSINTLLKTAENNVNMAKAACSRNDKNNASDELKKGADDQLQRAQKELEQLQAETSSFGSPAAAIKYAKLFDAKEILKKNIKQNPGQKHIDLTKASEDEILLHSKALNVKWDRVQLTMKQPDPNDTSQLIETPIECGRGKTIQESMALFKKSLEELSGSSISDRDLYEMMNLIDSEGISSGYNDGTDPSIGLALGREGKKGAMDAVVITMNEGSFDLAVTGGASFLNSVTVPTTQGKKITSSLNMTEDGAINRNLNSDHQHLPQFETSTSYLYKYAPVGDSDKEPKVDLADSRQMFWPRDINAEVAAEAATAVMA